MPEHELIVQGNAVLLVERKVLKAVHTEDFFRELASSTILHSGILPHGCICVSKKDDRTLAVMETSPRMVPLIYRDDTYRVSLPFAQFYVVLSSANNGNYGLNRCFVSCTKKPIRQMEDAVFRLPTPNVFPDGHVCLGGIRCESAPLREVTADLMQKFWGSPFNHDLALHFPHFLDRSPARNIPEVLREWEKESKANNFFALEETTRYAPHTGLTFEGVIKQCLS